MVLYVNMYDNVIASIIQPYVILWFFSVCVFFAWLADSLINMALCYFVCKCVSVLEFKRCQIVSVVIQRAKRKTAVAILVLQFSNFYFLMNFSLCTKYILSCVFLI